MFLHFFAKKLSTNACPEFPSNRFVALFDQKTLLFPQKWLKKDSISFNRFVLLNAGIWADFADYYKRQQGLSGCLLAN